MPAIDHLFHISAPQDQVYAQLNTVEGLSGWWTKDSRGKASQDGEVEFYFNGSKMCTMKVETEQAPDILIWNCIEGHPDWIGTKVNFRLDQNEGKTRIVFSHSGWEKQDDFYARCNFSWGHYLVSLRDLCEKGVGEPWPG